MDNRASAMFREGLETEKRMQVKFLKEMDLSDAKDIPASAVYRSSSIAAMPYKKELVQPTQGFKPVTTKENFDRAKKSFGMCASELMYSIAAKDNRPPCQVFRGTGKLDEMAMRLPPPALRNNEYYGKPDATSHFYRRSGAFAATVEK